MERLIVREIHCSKFVQGKDNWWPKHDGYAESYQRREDMPGGKDKENLCRKVLKVQLAMGWPGIIMEVKEIWHAIGLEDVTTKYLDREKVKEYMQCYEMKIAKEKM